VEAGAHTVNQTLASALIVLALIVIEALFVAAEIALVSLREGQLRALAAGKRGAAVARLVSNPNRFLATVQIGVTLTALLSSAYGAVSLSETAKRALINAGFARGLAGFLGVVGVTLVISYVTLVIGELAPKRLGLQRAEAVALTVGPPLEKMATLSRPAIWLLSRSTDLVVRLLGGDPRVGRERMTEAELRDLVVSHEALEPDERRLITEVFAAGDRQLREVMIPRTEVDFLDAGTPVAQAARMAVSSPHSRYPVVAGSHDNVIGFVHVRDLLDPAVVGATSQVGDIVREVKLLPATKKVLPSLSEMRREGHHLAIVVDEYGGTDGIVSLEDLVEELVGDIRDEYDLASVGARRLTSGDIEVDGLLNLDEFAEETGLRLPDGPYETAAGFLMSALGHVPEQGESVRCAGYLLTVAEMDGRRVARIRVSAQPSAPTGPAPTGQTPAGQTAGGQSPPGQRATGAPGPSATDDGPSEQVDHAQSAPFSGAPPAKS
jgi:putative hemolysin